jgi:hypothetical protein
MHHHHVTSRALLGLALPAAFALAGCNNSGHATPPTTSAAATSFDSNVATQWMAQLYDCIKHTPLVPPVASRAIAYAGVTLYESVVPGIADHQSLAGQLNGFTGVPQPTGVVDYRVVANTALAAVIRGGVVPGILQADLDAGDVLEQSLNAGLVGSIDATVMQSSLDQGDAVAAAILAWAADDGYAEFHNCSYTPPVGPGFWQPLPGQVAVEPCWDLLRPFVLVPASKCAPPPQPDFDETPGSAYYVQADEVYTTTGDAGANLSPEQTEIAWFWSDGGGTGTPPGHWLSVVAQICATDQENLATAAEAFAKLGIGVADAFISCWQTKYQWSSERPVTYIQRVIDATWDPLLPTPPFAEYSSGHSVQSGAAAALLTDVFGARAFVDDTHNLHGNAGVLLHAPNPRSFTDFDTAAAEVAISRLYGGIHFRAAIDNGVAQGQCVANEILGNLQFLK